MSRLVFTSGCETLLRNGSIQGNASFWKKETSKQYRAVRVSRDPKLSLRCITVTAGQVDNFEYRFASYI